MNQLQEEQLDQTLSKVESGAFDLSAMVAVEQKLQVSDVYFTIRPVLVALSTKWWIGPKFKRAIKAFLLVLDVYFGIKG